MLDYLWSWFLQISHGTIVTGMAPPSLTWEGVSAWSKLTGNEPEPWEALVLVRLGRIRAIIQSEKAPDGN